MQETFVPACPGGGYRYGSMDKTKRKVRVPKAATGQPLRSAERMLDVLESFTTEEPALTVAEITHRLGLATSTVRRILDVLEKRGFVRLDPVSGRFSPFVEIVRLAATAVQGNDLIAGARSAMDHLRDASGENVQLTVLVGRDVVFVDRRVSNQTIKIFSPTGHRVPAWDGRASGQVLLAWLPEKQLAAALPAEDAWTRPTPSAPKSPQAFLAILAKVRERGYAINDELTERDVWAIAAPIRDHTSHVVAAISVPALKPRVTDPKRVTELVDLTLKAAREISARLNYYH